MASSLPSNNNSSTKSPLTNSYFFYGTHPLKVPNNITSSNSANNISSTYAQTTHHLSLHNGSLSISEKSITQSLRDIPNSCINEDETSEVYYFAYKTKKQALDFSFIIYGKEFFLLLSLP